MALGQRKESFQGELSYYSGDIGSSLNPFYEALNRLLCKAGCDKFVEQVCREFYAAGYRSCLLNFEFGPVSSGYL